MCSQDSFVIVGCHVGGVSLFCHPDISFSGSCPVAHFSFVLVAVLWGSWLVWEVGNKEQNFAAEEVNKERKKEEEHQRQYTADSHQVNIWAIIGDAGKFSVTLMVGLTPAYKNESINGTRNWSGQSSFRCLLHKSWRCELLEERIFLTQKRTECSPNQLENFSGNI